MPTHNVVELLKAGLEREVRKVLTEELVREELKAFEVRLRDRLGPIVNAITLDKIGGMRNMMEFRDELRVYFKWNNDEIEETDI